MKFHLMHCMCVGDKGGKGMTNSLKDVLEIVTEGMDEIDVLIMLIQTSVAAEIAIQRQRKGMTQGDLAKKMNVSASVVSKWESGLRDLRLSTLVRIADALDMEIRSPFATDTNVGSKEGETDNE